MPSSFFFNDTATTEIYTLSLHDALPILPRSLARVAPELAATALPLARRTLAPFGLLLWLLAWVDKGLHGLVATRRPLEPDLGAAQRDMRSEEHTSELQSQSNLVCRLLLEKKK